MPSTLDPRLSTSSTSTNSPGGVSRAIAPPSSARGFLPFLLLAIIAWPVILKICRRNLSPNSTIPTSSPTRNFPPPSAQHWFGTDLHGRDLFSRVLFGAQISLLVGVVGAVVSLVIGVLWGAMAGYVGGRVDSAF